MNLSNIITQTKSLSTFNDTKESVQQAMGEAARLLLRCFNGVLELCLCSGTAGAHPDPVYTAPCNLSPWHSVCVCVCVCVCVSDGVHCSLCGCYPERVFINYHNYCKTPHTQKTSIPTNALLRTPSEPSVSPTLVRMENNWMEKERVS